jgi:hypothetical protein
MLEGLRKVGYVTNTGEEDTGAFFHLLRGGGYYLGMIQSVVNLRSNLYEQQINRSRSMSADYRRQNQDQVRWGD